MSAKPTPDPKEVQARLHWVKAGSPELSVVPEEWRAVAVELYDALDLALTQLEAAGKCRKCGKPIGSYCLPCAWPHRRSQKGQTDG
jgi:hypothetical protein